MRRSHVAEPMLRRTLILTPHQKRLQLMQNHEGEWKVRVDDGV